MDPLNILIIENFVNSEEAVKAVEEAWDWDRLHDLLKPHLASPLTEEEEQALHDDLRDWWKNGNFHTWEEGEVNSFGMSKWRIGDLDFWDRGLDFDNVMDHYLAAEEG